MPAEPAPAAPHSGQKSTASGAPKETRCREAVNDRFGAIDPRQSDRSGAVPPVPTKDRSGAKPEAADLQYELLLSADFRPFG